MISRDLVASQLGEEAEEVVSCGVIKKNYKFGIFPGPRGTFEREISFEYFIRIFQIFNILSIFYIV